jgi:hypothetical protein
MDAKFNHEQMKGIKALKSHPLPTGLRAHGQDGVQCKPLSGYAGHALCPSASPPTLCASGSPHTHTFTTDQD